MYFTRTCKELTNNSTKLEDFQKYKVVFLNYLHDTVQIKNVSNTESSNFSFKISSYPPDSLENIGGAILRATV